MPAFERLNTAPLAIDPKLLRVALSGLIAVTAGACSDTKASDDGKNADSSKASLSDEELKAVC